MASASASPNTNNSQYPQWHNIVSGAAAGAGARLLTAPLDLLKIRRQLQSKAISTKSEIIASSTSRSASSATNFFQKNEVISNVSHIIKNEGGIKGLFRGNVAATYLWIGYAAVQFSLYARTSNFLTSFSPYQNEETNPSNLIHDRIHNSYRNPLALNPPLIFQNLLSNIGSNPAATAFCSGAAAGVAATLFTYPFDICRTIFAAKGITTTSTQILSSTSSISPPPPPNSIYQFVQTMYAKNGLRGFFIGSVPAVIQIIPYMGINFALYDYLMRVANERAKRIQYEEGGTATGKVNASGAGIAGFIAGGTSKMLVYPLDTVKKRLQAQTFMLVTPASPTSITTKYNGMLDCIVTISKQEGIPAFYKGLVPTVLKSMAGTGFSFFFFTFTKNTLETIHDSSKSFKHND